MYIHSGVTRRSFNFTGLLPLRVFVCRYIRLINYVVISYYGRVGYIPTVQITQCKLGAGASNFGSANVEYPSPPN